MHEILTRLIHVRIKYATNGYNEQYLRFRDASLVVRSLVGVCCETPPNRHHLVSLLVIP